MTAPVFVDSNVLLYAVDEADQKIQGMAGQLGDMFGSI